MALKIIENTKNRLKIKLVDEDHTLVNALRQELWNDSDVEVSGYRIKHSLVDSPELVIETSKKDAVATLQNAINRIKKDNQEFIKLFKKL